MRNKVFWSGVLTGAVATGVIAVALWARHNPDGVKAVQKTLWKLTREVGDKLTDLREHIKVGSA